MKIEWSAVTKLGGENQGEYTGRGVYIWGFMLADSFLPYYVGIAQNVHYRVIQHLNSLLGGRYTIYHKDSLSKFRDHKSGKGDIKANVGMLYLPDWPRNYLQFVFNRKLLQPHIDFMVDNFAYSYAKVEDQTQLRNIEKLCINRIGIENLGNSKAGTTNDVTISHTDFPC
jgi:hypothetical protein